MTEILDTATYSPAQNDMYVPKAQLDKVLADVEMLRKHNADHVSQIGTLNSRISNLKQEVKQFIIDNIESGYVSKDEFIELGEALDIPMTQSISFTVSVTFSATAEVPLGTDLDDLGYELSDDISLSVDYNGSVMESFDWDSPEVEVSDVEVQ